MSIPNRLSEPRSYMGTAIMFGTYFLAWMWLCFAASNVIVDGEPLGRAITQALLPAAIAGVVFGLIMGSIMRGETLQIGVREPESFLARVNVAAAELGYQPRLVAPSMLSFRPSWQAGLLAGSILVQLCGEKAVLVGPRIYLRRLRSRLVVAA